ncbi:DUF1800 family protein [Falsiroseomonas sp.]|uniref:DUF1800 domain-containing protein n=1 Tax=Falsiroseomonas sp. TaxID=2870721 RepID=UPI0027270519|nr:DUF1800 domain-containing protein [Falsiroseomonas sp.]MDO9501520.1 DUF1800 domain-containing protein [Falsiroseomonas sp.]
MSMLGHIAAIRFGLGLRLGEAPPAQPQAWLLEQIDQPAPPPDGVSLAEALTIRQADIVARRPRDPEGDPQQTRAAIAALLRQETEGWAARRLEAEQPFRERLVDFWMNHFTVSRRAGSTSVLIGSYEREAIRPHVTGRFADMVVAVARHPAMLIYLDNWSSIGPGSPTGRRSRRGLNENLAREMLELHTLSPAGGYTQNDVQELAKILTGWTFTGASTGAGDTPGFRFRANAHEPGEKFLLGRRFGPGEAAGEAALRLLAEHPATWRHLAVKLARHFVADNPPPEAVRTLEWALRDSKGDLAETSRALVALPQAWDPPLTKLRAPVDYVLAASRAMGRTAREARPMLGALASLGQPLWIAPQPIGWPDIAAEWATPDALMRRIDWAFTLAGRMERLDGMAVAEAALGPLGRAETAQAMRRAGSMRDSLTLLLGSPEFMHR